MGIPTGIDKFEADPLPDLSELTERFNKLKTKEQHDIDKQGGGIKEGESKEEYDFKMTKKSLLDFLDFYYNDKYSRMASNNAYPEKVYDVLVRLERVQEIRGFVTKQDILNILGLSKQLSVNDELPMHLWVLLFNAREWDGFREDEIMAYREYLLFLDAGLEEMKKVRMEHIEELRGLKRDPKLSDREKADIALEMTESYQKRIKDLNEKYKVLAYYSGDNIGAKYYTLDLLSQTISEKGIIDYAVYDKIPWDFRKINGKYPNFWEMTEFPFDWKQLIAEFN